MLNSPVICRHCVGGVLIVLTQSTLAGPSGGIFGVDGNERDGWTRALMDEDE